MSWRSTLRRWRRWWRRLMHGDVEHRGAPELQHIKHVVVLMLENRSFDHVLGSLGERVDGVTPDMVNHDLAGNPCKVGALELPRSSAFIPGPPHGHDSVHVQIGDGTMSGFVRAYQEAYPEAADLDPGDVMRQLARPHQPMTYFLADEFTICNRWFSAVPTNTIPNRLYSLA